MARFGQIEESLKRPIYPCAAEGVAGKCSGCLLAALNLISMTVIMQNTKLKLFEVRVYFFLKVNVQVDIFEIGVYLAQLLNLFDALLLEKNSSHSILAIFL